MVEADMVQTCGGHYRTIFTICDVFNRSVRLAASSLVLNFADEVIFSVNPEIARQVQLRKSLISVKFFSFNCRY